MEPKKLGLEEDLKFSQPLYSLKMDKKGLVVQQDELFGHLYSTTKQWSPSSLASDPASCQCLLQAAQVA